MYIVQGTRYGVYIVQGTGCGVYIVRGTRCGVYIVKGTRCDVYIAVFSPGHFRVAARYAFILEGLAAATP